MLSKIVAILFFVVQTFAFPVILQDGIVDNNNNNNDDDHSLTQVSWVFHGDWQENITNGHLTAGTYFKIVYNGTRLPGRETRYGHKAWYIRAKYMLNNNPYVHSEELEGPDEENILTKEIFLPFGTHHISLWFKHYGYPGLRNGYYNTGESYDSDHGKNYNSMVLPPKHTIVFEKNWQEHVYGDLKRGGEFVIMYSSERLSNPPITAVVKYSRDDVIHDYPLKASEKYGYVTATIHIPSHADKIIIWFYKQVNAEETQYDSNYGNNYKFQVSGKKTDISLA